MTMSSKIAKVSTQILDSKEKKEGNLGNKFFCRGSASMEDEEIENKISNKSDSSLEISEDAVSDLPSSSEESGLESRSEWDSRDSSFDNFGNLDDVLDDMKMIDRITMQGTVEDLIEESSLEKILEESDGETEDSFDTEENEAELMEGFVFGDDEEVAPLKRKTSSDSQAVDELFENVEKHYSKSGLPDTYPSTEKSSSDELNELGDLLHEKKSTPKRDDLSNLMEQIDCEDLSFDENIESTKLPELDEDLSELSDDLDMEGELVEETDDLDIELEDELGRGIDANLEETDEFENGIEGLELSPEIRVEDAGDGLEELFEEVSDNDPVSEALQEEFVPDLSQEENCQLNTPNKLDERVEFDVDPNLENDNFEFDQREPEQFEKEPSDEIPEAKLEKGTVQEHSALENEEEGASFLQKVTSNPTSDHSAEARQGELELETQAQLDDTSFEEKLGRGDDFQVELASEREEEAVNEDFLELEVGETPLHDGSVEETAPEPAGSELQSQEPDPVYEKAVCEEETVASEIASVSQELLEEEASEVENDLIEKARASLEDTKFEDMLENEFREEKPEEKEAPENVKEIELDEDFDPHSLHFASEATPNEENLNEELDEGALAPLEVLVNDEVEQRRLESLISEDDTTLSSMEIEQEVEMAEREVDKDTLEKARERLDDDYFEKKLEESIANQGAKPKTGKTPENIIILEETEESSEVLMDALEFANEQEAESEIEELEEINEVLSAEIRPASQEISEEEPLEKFPADCQSAPTQALEKEPPENVSCRLWFLGSL